ncbi:YciN family protein [Xenorhabdus sp. ZM]|uniref:YciN family protein n=1 Tax=Xenorhabdus szentirmaii TaxID=290112 RepID=UPI0019CC6399|nr:YciN family protein [Xenorhabdus sp. ZM]MBD2805712.1 YciN family protein [Xenorhabdus sp. ZM]
MQTKTPPIKKEQLLKKANEIIQSHEDYIQGMYAASVERKNGVLIFQGEYFLDENGLPTAKSTAAFNMFKQLAHILSAQYHLVD